MDDCVLYHRLFFGEENTPYIESISIDTDLHVKLHHKGNPIPLPEWFRKCTCKLTSASMLENLVSHMHNVVEEMPRNVLSKINKLSYYKPQGRPSYSNELLRFALMQRYTSKQAYSLLLDEFPLPSLSYLKTLSKGGVEPIKALKLMLENGEVSSDCVLFR